MHGLSICLVALALSYGVYTQESAEQILSQNLDITAQPDATPAPAGQQGAPRTTPQRFSAPKPNPRTLQKSSNDQAQRAGIKQALRQVKASIPDDPRRSIRNLIKDAEKFHRNYVPGSSFPSVYLPTSHRPVTECPFNHVPSCNRNAKYRSIDGSCNNLDYPGAGMHKTPFSRLTRPIYDDGVNTPRTKHFHSPGPLPSARTVSLSVHGTTIKPSQDHTHELMGTAQFLDHDVTLTASAVEEGGDVPACCDGGPSHPLCMPIFVEPGDPEFTTECINFIRSSAAPNLQCSPDARQQLNDLTAYIDASNIYGSSETKSNELRAGEGGLLKFQYIHGKEHLPDKADNPPSCALNSAPDTCSFDAGDSRNSEQAGLTSQHTLWLRFHNRLARKLKALNHNWNDEKLFQETRKIVGAIWQRIIFKEWLPKIIGPDMMNKWQLNLRDYGYSSDYEPRVDVSIMNVFATAAFRFGHSLVSQKFSRLFDDYAADGMSDISEMFRAVGHTRTYGADKIMIGQLEDKAQVGDRFCVDGLRNKLFNSELDLPALNIQRGRDHGLASYLDIRRIFKLRIPSSYGQMSRTHEQDAIAGLENVYPHVKDLEIFPAGLSEKRLPGAAVGETFANILGLQFFRLKTGDRFWHERQNRIHGFNRAQIAQIRKITFAQIHCLVTDITEIQPDVFLSSSVHRNGKIPCSRLGDIDLRPFSDSGSSGSGGSCRYGDWRPWSPCVRRRQTRRRECRVGGTGPKCNKCRGRAYEYRRCGGGTRNPYRYRTHASRFWK